MALYQLCEKIKKSEIPLLFLSNNGEDLFKNFFDNISLNLVDNFFEVRPSLDTNFSSFKIDRNLINQFKNGPSLSTNYLKINGIKRPDIIFKQNVNGITNDNPLIFPDNSPSTSTEKFISMQDNTLVNG